MKKRGILKSGIRSILIVALLLSMSSLYVPLHISTIPSYFGIAFPLIFAFSALLAFLSFFSIWKNKVFFILFFVAVLFVPRFIALFGNEGGNDEGLKVLSFNVRGGYSILNNDNDEEASKLKSLKQLLLSNLDIILLQETNQRVEDWTSEYFPFSHRIASKRKGTMIATNLDVVDQGEIDFGTKVNSCVWMDIKTSQGIIRVYNVHFQSSKIYEDTEKAIDEGKKYNSDVFTSLGKIYNKYRKHSLRRVKQAELVKAHIEHCEYPVVLGGDFNEAPMSYTYQLMKKGLEDHFEKGSGYGATYPESSPLIRIDYLMSSKKITCDRFEILRNISLSDHLPILSTIRINSGQQK